MRVLLLTNILIETLPRLPRAAGDKALVALKLYLVHPGHSVHDVLNQHKPVSQ